MTGATHDFDQSLLSGFLDEELTQRDSQRVRVHLETCGECARTLDRMRATKEATMATEFEVPDDTQWDETPRGSGSRLLRDTGWVVLGVWIAALIGYAIWQVVTEAANLFEAVLVFGLWLGVALVFLSVLIDRLRTRKTDRYRKVEK